MKMEKQTKLFVICSQQSSGSYYFPYKVQELEERGVNDEKVQVL